ncbi:MULTISPECIES: hypothetical protein [Nonomuraea]|jgi:YHS domain-containing protein|uniref:YHS domain-containing protein n=1 Tax=Nonomuraea salmonea TaxID=46181 RepID=A0ABV5P002_9ACTN
MLLIDVYVPKGALSEQEQQELGRRLIDTLMVEDDGSHAKEVIDAQRTITQVLVHEPATWVLGDRQAPADPPRYLVRVTVPASWRKDMCEPIPRIVTGVLAETERAAGRDPGRLEREPHAVVLLEGVTEGGIGIFGREMSSMDLMELVSRPYRDKGAEKTEAIDPVCGMAVTLDDPALTLVHEGVRYGFCNGLCRRAFADEHGLSLSRRDAS